MGLLWIDTALSLLTTPILPVKAVNFGFIVEEIFQSLEDEYKEVLLKNGVTLGQLSY